MKIRDIKPIENINEQLGMLLAMFEDGTAEWRRELTELELPQEALTWRPQPNAQSIGNIITHIARVEEQWIHNLAFIRELPEDELMRIFDSSKLYNERDWGPAADQPLEDYFTQCDEVRSKSIEVIHKLGDPELTSIRIEKDYGYTLRWIVHHVITHEAYHGGQAALLGMLYGGR